ncbi:MAG: hypothetical protein ACR5K9_07965 [Wolbachia sp.]
MEERLRAKGTSKDKKMTEDNKDSGYSSGFATDAEKGEKSPKHRSQSPVGRGSPEKSLRRDSSSLSKLELLSLDRFSHKTDKRWAY